MKRWLLPEGTNFYKANLHCHTNISDGKFTPEEIKQVYMSQGYSVIAFTDHEIMIAHPELAEENFIPLNGYEYEVISPEKADNPAHKLRKTCHMCLIALEPDNLDHVCWHREKYLWGNAVNYRPQAKYRDEDPDFTRVYNGECISEVMQTARKNGFFVTYNHPVWSMEDMADIQNYHGMHAMEIYNHGCVVTGYDDYNPNFYDAMLRRGERIYCIATDDNHNAKDQCGGWTTICAEKLEYRTITKALEDGHFYASTGPEIRALWFEDGKIHVECSPAVKITATYGARKVATVLKDEGELTEATFPVLEDDIYVRLTVTDALGNHANTNAYFVDDLF